MPGELWNTALYLSPTSSKGAAGEAHLISLRFIRVSLVPFVCLLSSKSVAGIDERIDACLNWVAWPGFSLADNSPGA